MAKPKVRATQPKPPPKTAVIMVHGMGEQRPLETIRSFVESVYQHDTSLASTDTDDDNMLRIAIVPDGTTGSGELRRLTTLNDGPAKRTDFFELYWADIMDGTPVEMVTSWIDGLLLRSPWRVPAHARVYLAWLMLWGLALIVVFAAIATAYPQVANLLGPVDRVLDWLTLHHIVVGQVAYVVGAAYLTVLIVKGVRGGQQKLETTPLFLPAVLLAGGLVLSLWPAKQAISGHLLAAAVTAGVGSFMHFLVAPYLGDVVRYVRATPSTVERRRLIRERGLALLEAIHEKRADSTDNQDFVRAATDDPPAYDRIVLVAHSLGTYVAYDILQMFWEKYGPTHHQQWHPEVPSVQAALADVDAFVKKEWVADPAESYPLADYLAAQANLRQELFQAAPQWRITDLITLGSPLVHAEFLATDGTADLEQGFVQRRFAACPPRPDPTQGSMLYPTVTDGPKYPHFAAHFAAVKWTNICDESVVPFLGDLVSGRLRPIFGNGIDEHNVTIKRPGRIWPLNRVFTHTEYWTWEDSYKHGNLPEHLDLLRKALKIGT
ncbi:MAG: hypothetical protein ABI398_10875 [Devosia sp.]